MNDRHYAFLIWTTLLFILLPCPGPGLATAQEPCKDTRLDRLIDSDHFELRIQPVKSLAQWKERKKELRESLLLKAGLWPESGRTPLNASIFDERRGDGFTVAKIYFESLPGFLATGNLYRPTKGKPPYPAVISPHGHWQYGRLHNPIPGRCIDFARMGFVVLSLDMVGYNDSFQFPHNPYTSFAQLKADVPQPYEPRMMRADFDFPEMELYGFNLGGLQLLNSIRGVDFLSSLPEVDPERIGATGASGGATQTLLLMIADDRIKVAAPVNIIGAGKHPGCRCENFPGLWLDTSTVELTVAFAPKPLLLMSATEDPWTHSTPEREYPMIKKYYSLYDAEDKIKNVHINAGHNYNAETRAAVYEWFCKHLKSPFPHIENPPPVSRELKNLGDLRVFPDKILPEEALSGWDIMKNWKAASERAYEELLPKSTAEYNEFAHIFRGKLANLLAVQETLIHVFTLPGEVLKTNGKITFEKSYLAVPGKGSCVEVESIYSEDTSSGTILLVYPESFGGFFIRGSEHFRPWVKNLLGKKYRISRVRGYASGQLSIPHKTWESMNWSNAYNPDNILNGIHDIITAINAQTTVTGLLSVVGLDDCGIPTAFACAVSGAADCVIIDMNGRDPGYDGELVSLMPYGAIKRVGDFRTAALLLMQKKLVLCNPGQTFDSEWYRKQAERLGFGENLEFRSPVTIDTFVDFCNEDTETQR